MRFVRAGSLSIALALIGAACSSDDGGEVAVFDAASSGGKSGDVVVVENQGGALEGHTPRGFPGMGTGLFVGDNLNPGFPDGDGVQLFLTFELPDDQAVSGRVILRSDLLQVAGDPFADLGALSAAPVSYSDFGPELFDLEPEDEAVGCDRARDLSIECDVTSAVGAAIEAGEGRVQFRLRFDRAGDSDGSPDLAMFNRGDSNANDSGIFRLEFG